MIINIIMDSLNSLSFGGEPPKSEYMKESPIKKGLGLFIRGAKSRITLSTVAFIIAYALLLFTPLNILFQTEVSRSTARFVLLCFMAVLNGFNIRTEHINLLTGLKNNKLFVRIAIGIFVGVIITCTFAGDLVKVCPLNITQWIAVSCLSIIVVPVDIARKLYLKKRR